MRPQPLNLTDGDILIFCLVLLRLFYVNKVASIISAFNAHSDEQLARAKERKSFLVTFVLMLVVSVAELIQFFIILLTPSN